MTDLILIDKLKELDSKLFSALDLNFAAFVCRGAGEVDNYPLFLAAALVSNASVNKKYTCLDIDSLSGDLSTYFNELSDFDIQEQETFQALRDFPIPANWSVELRNSDSVAVVNGAGEVGFLPLVLDGSFLYIYRDWMCEQALAKMFRDYCSNESVCGSSNLYRKITGISSFFKPMDKKIDWQQLAVFAALRQNFTVISGGPGTGKTTVAAALSAMFIEDNPEIKITLCAPTGKAQERLRESIRGQIDTLNCDEAIKSRLQDLPVSTIHRLLGGRPDTPHFRYHKNHKLVLDVLIVDEASMISQSLMKALLEAVPSGSKLVMLGDMRQLASVESGMVLRDFCSIAGSNKFSSDFIKDFKMNFPEVGSDLEAEGNENDIFANTVIELKENHRFASDRGLGLCATAISELPEYSDIDSAEKIIDQMRNDSSGEIELANLPLWLKHGFEKSLDAYLKKVFVDFEGRPTKYLDFQKLDTVERAYELFNKFRVLCVHRRGMYGAEAVNRLIEQLFIPQTKYGRHIFYRGKPIIINENNYAMGLFNGDTGIIWPDSDGRLKAFFPGNEADNKEFRDFDLNLLPAFSPAYAITVHKAQGSGFQQVLIITPEKESPLMTREMVYTALSRAEKKAVFWTNRNALSSALSSVTRRSSNLRNYLSVSSEIDDIDKSNKRRMHSAQAEPERSSRQHSPR